MQKKFFSITKIQNYINQYLPKNVILSCLLPQMSRKCKICVLIILYKGDDGEKEKILICISNTKIRDYPEEVPFFIIASV